MKRGLFAFITLIYLSIQTSCSGSEDDTFSCDVSTETYTVNTDGIVTYTVTASGSSNISSITYLGPDGMVTAPNPGNNFNLTVPLKKGNTINLSVKGTAIEGQLRAYYKFTGTTGSEEKENIKICPGE